MRPERRRTVPAFVVPVVVSALTACADKPVEWTFAPPSASVREQLLGDVTVVPVGCKPDYSVPTPVQGRGAGASEGASQAAAVGAAPGALLCTTGIGCVVGLPAALAGSLVGAIGGTVVGAAKAHSADEVIAAETTLRDIMTSTPADERLADLILAKAEGTGIAASVKRAEKGAVPDELAKKDLVSSLMVSVLNFSLISSGRIEPTVSLIIGVKATIEETSTPDDWSRMWVYRSAYRPFFDLAADDGSLLREEINTGLAAVATKVVTDVFVTEVAESYVEPATAGSLTPGVVRPVISVISCYVE